MRIQLIFLACAVMLSTCAAAQDLSGQIAELAAAEGFEIKNIEIVSGAFIEPSGGNLMTRIERLLNDYNYVSLNDEAGKLKTLIIVSRKQESSKPARNISVVTKRDGMQHEVNAVLTGPTGKRMQAALMVDTGASTIVLPNSMIDPLGFGEAMLTQAWVQTANGKIAVTTGTLRSVQVGRAISRDVAVSFVNDGRLGGKRLLGMSFLRDYQVVIDDDESRLMLLRK